MSAVYNPESDVVERIERLELEAREIRRRVEHTRQLADQRVLNRQLRDIEDEVTFLRHRLP